MITHSEMYSVLDIECELMLENWRYNRALEANAKQVEAGAKEILLDEEYRTQLALEYLGIREDTTPSEAPKVGSLLVRPDLMANLRVPYAVEVLGMPRAGKSTAINRYLKELWLRGERYKLAFVEEGPRKIEPDYGDLRYSDPFHYSLLGGTATFFGYIEALKNVNSGMRLVVSDRGQIDRRAFRRVLFGRGDVDPKVMEDEGEFMYDLENTPVQIGGVIMMMTRPEISFGRGKPGPVANKDFLPRLYEQYWRLHGEILQGEVPYRIYACIDGEKDKEEVYERFKYAMDTALNIHEIYLAALAKAFPDEFSKAKAEQGKRGRRPSRAQRILGERLGGKKVLIVGGDEMESEEEVLDKSFIEGLDLRKRL